MQEWNEVKAINAGVEALVATIEMPEIRGGIAHSLKTSGKRLRPLTLLLVNELNHGSMDEALDAAMAMECIHTASLIQDDILDAGLKRRGEITSHEKFGIFLAMVSGDYMISRAMMLMSHYGPKAVSCLRPIWKRGRRGRAPGREVPPDQSPRWTSISSVFIRRRPPCSSPAFEMGARIAGADEKKATCAARWERSSVSHTRSSTT